MEILTAPKVPTWKQRLAEWPVSDPLPVSIEDANTVRAEISKLKKYENRNFRAKTWHDEIEVDGVATRVLMVERLPDAE